MQKLLKLSHHRHTGRLLAHEHTSYFLLVIVLIALGVVLTISSRVGAQSPGPFSSSVGLSGTVPAPPPDEAAVITSPGNQERFSSSPITVSGTCPAGTLVEVLKSNIFAGSVFCTNSGEFSVSVDLLIGQNDLVARVYNPLNQPGPTSNSVTVFYDALPPQASSLAPLNFTGSQLILNTDAVYRGIFPDQAFSMPIEIIGGTAPFALNVGWGDSESSTVPRDNNQPFEVSHAYKKPGTYNISLQATDAEGRVAFLNVVAVVNGQPDEVAATTSSDDESGLAGILGNMAVLWPLYVGTFTTVVSFWLGEQREKQILRRHGAI